ncbi:XTP/dITP diphosphatase [Clostridium botulinum]|uniref:dITP/XTP pyrophosphatase n=1 Tax=Clostridium botulinum C/D str. DC5 TaxID=1443128 RepID=A0A0A0IFZ6_CLOBO|nr:XTP/dITP diphosphatase [Clostridium botulinum]KEI05705.1 nucleoside-triphosphate diphosphatase [Clostridium botulinum C/D str. BKT75002]KEI12266.1 nucleoside-triphosphate diphosphatase [Clostridium botulinum C/D str. BKT2873]KGM94650.1 nucleoside-triphosphate diphosphatase [Clostridium botulinum D str. CCUG 7971]KGM99907.1 nucleoside-triphosphate diphosphatase [Clostridium botulinum C/D str. DC5]KOC49388.1 nucleoside-triphosphate diphosphatase [Clostridium botulinum]
MKKIIVASNNQHKIEEIKEILKGFDLNILSLKEAGINVDVEENGTTFAENAHIKAEEIFKLVKDAMVLADDSGLMVDILNGEPGVYSARYSGEHGNDKKNNEKLLSKLNGVKFTERKAKFVCAIELIVDENTIIDVQGEVEGYILEKERGVSGFGYDPLFYVPQFNKSMAEITPEEKNSISHRGKALKKLKKSIDVL